MTTASLKAAWLLTWLTVMLFMVGTEAIETRHLAGLLVFTVILWTVRFRLFRVSAEPRAYRPMRPAWLLFAGLTATVVATLLFVPPEEMRRPFGRLLLFAVVGLLGYGALDAWVTRRKHSHKS